MIKYFHELRPEEWEWLKAENTTWGEVIKDFPQPPWCEMPNAIDPLGCWSLIGFKIVSREYCNTCEYCRT